MNPELITRLNLLWKPVYPYLAQWIENRLPEKDVHVLEIGPFSRGHHHFPAETPSHATGNHRFGRIGGGQGHSSLISCSLPDTDFAAGTSPPVADLRAW